MGTWPAHLNQGEHGMQQKPHTLFLLTIVLASLAAGTGCDKLRARDKLNKGVQAYKGGLFDAAIEDFKAAKELDPSLTNARLFLASAYAGQYIPGAPSDENVRVGQQAIQEWQQVLEKDPNNLNAIDGIASIQYNMSANPFDPKKMEEAKTYHEKHIQIKSDDPTPYYSIAVIDWSLAYRGNKDFREEYNKTAKKTLRDTDPMPPPLATKFQEKYGSIVDEGIADLQKAIGLRQDYDDAMAYLNLLDRQKADMETDPAARDADLKAADDLVEKVKAIKQKKMENQPSS
jgi:tetratricopeptide (TPR) repeat protein